MTQIWAIKGPVVPSEPNAPVWIHDYVQKSFTISHYHSQLLQIYIKQRTQTTDTIIAGTDE
jgi:hypothetical protein